MRRGVLKKSMTNIWVSSLAPIERPSYGPDCTHEGAQGGQQKHDHFVSRANSSEDRRNGPANQVGPIIRGNDNGGAQFRQLQQSIGRHRKCTYIPATRRFGIHFFVSTDLLVTTRYTNRRHWPDPRSCSLTGHGHTGEYKKESRTLQHVHERCTRRTTRSNRKSCLFAGRIVSLP